MTPERRLQTLGAILLVFFAAACAPEGDGDTMQAMDGEPGMEAQDGDALGTPMFEPDPDWPQPYPAHWVIGPGTGIHVDSRDHIWVLHRPERISDEDMEAAFDPDIPDCCERAPPLMEITPDGELLQAWGSVEPSPDWPLMPHGVFVDHNDYVWVATSIHHQVMKYTRDGEHLLTIGEFDEVGGSDDPNLLGGSADIYVDPETNELYIADGYANRRVVVFDAETGEYLRHWGAYGEAPDDDYEYPEDELPRQFRLPHGIDGSNDGRIYVGDRNNSRVQAFERDGTFIGEGIVREGSTGAFDVAFSHDPDQSYVYVADGGQHQIVVMRRGDLEVVDRFGGEGTGPGEMGRPHNLAADSEGNIYVAEADPGRRFQKFIFQGFGPVVQQ